MPLRKTLTVAVLAGLLGAGFAAPAAAGDWGHPGYGRPHWGGGYGGYHGNWGGRGGWGNGGAAAAAALGGLALGAVVGAAAQHHAYDEGDCYPVDRPVTDAWGAVIEYRRTMVCD